MGENPIKALKFGSLTAVVLLVCSCAQLAKDYEAEPTTALTDTTVTALGLRSISVRETALRAARTWIPEGQVQPVSP